MERKVRVPLFKLSFWSSFPKLPTKWRKQAQKSSNVWHKPSQRCLRGPRDIFSSPASQTRLRTVRPQCAAGEPQMRRIQPQPKQESRVESTQLSWHCPRTVSDSAGDRLFPFTQKQDTRFGTVNQSVSFGIPSWSDEKEEGTMDPATWCSEVPHLQWWRSYRSCLHNYGSSNVFLTFQYKEWEMCVFSDIICLNWPVSMFSLCVLGLPKLTKTNVQQPPQ